MLIGAHVRAGASLVPALSRAEGIGAEVVQVFTQSPRAWKPTQYGDDVLAAYRQAQEEHPSVRATFCHATYLINLAAPDSEVLERSRSCLRANLAVARGIGASGLVLHLGSHRGIGFAQTLGQVADGLVGAWTAAPLVGDGRAEDCPILLENAAGAGDTMGRSFEELAAVLEVVGDGAGLGVCLDTQHLWASGIDFGTLRRADHMVESFDRVIGLEHLRCLHLNDSKVPLGGNRDRHENLGEGTIGTGALGALLGHPRLQGLPAILEVAGSGEGPRHQDIETARAVLAEGLLRRRRARSHAVRRTRKEKEQT